jgi:hypothetical protein
MHGVAPRMCGGSMFARRTSIWCLTEASSRAASAIATILSVQRGKFDYVDVVGEHMIGDKRIAFEGVVIVGHWWHRQYSSKFRKT